MPEKVIDVHGPRRATIPQRPVKFVRVSSTAGIYQVNDEPVSRDQYCDHLLRTRESLRHEGDVVARRKTSIDEACSWVEYELDCIGHNDDD